MPYFPPHDQLLVDSLQMNLPVYIAVTTIACLPSNDEAVSLVTLEILWGEVAGDWFGVICSVEKVENPLTVEPREVLWCEASNNVDLRLRELCCVSLLWKLFIACVILIHDKCTKSLFISSSWIFFHCMTLLSKSIPKFSSNLMVWVWDKQSPILCRRVKACGSNVYTHGDMIYNNYKVALSNVQCTEYSWNSVYSWVPLLHTYKPCRFYSALEPWLRNKHAWYVIV